MLAELAAAEIAKIAFEAVIGKLTEGAMDKGVELWQKIKQKLQKEPTAAKVLAAAEQTKSEAMIEPTFRTFNCHTVYYPPET
jgi:hypothetical protein